MIGRLAVGSVVGTQLNGSGWSVQAGHKAKAKYSSTNDRHDPMDLRSRRPSVPTAKVVNNCQTSGNGGRTGDRWE